MFSRNCPYLPRIPPPTGSILLVQPYRTWCIKRAKASREMSWQGAPSSPSTGKPLRALYCVRVGNRAQDWMGGGDRTSDLCEMCLRNQNFTVSWIPKVNSDPATAGTRTMGGRDAGRGGLKLEPGCNQSHAPVSPTGDWQMCLPVLSRPANPCCFCWSGGVSSLSRSHSC